MALRSTLPIATRARSWDGWGMAEWLPNPDPILKSMGIDISTYRDMRVDAHIGGCVRRRKAAVRSLETSLDKEGCPVRVAKAIEGILADLQATTSADEPGAQPGLATLIADALDGALYGYQPFEIQWGRAGTLIVPQSVTSKPPEWFCFDADNQLRFRSRDGGAYGELLPARKFLLARQEATYQNPYGLADLAMCFWPYTFRRAAKFWVAWLERYGGDFLIGKLPRSASPQEYQDLSDALAAMIQDSIAAIPDDGSVEVLASGSKGGSSDAHERFLLYWRGEITIALLGSNQGMETNATNASATASLDVARDIRDGDARMVESVVNQLIAWTCAINWPSVKPPVWTLREQEEIDTARPTRDKILVDCGVKFSRDYWLRTYDLDDSDIEDQSETTATVPVIAQPDDNPQAQQQAAEQAATPEPALAASNITAPDSVDIQTAKMSNQAAPTVDDWLARVRRDLDAYVKAGRSMADFAAHVLTMYPKLQSADLANIMGEAMAASELAGRYELAQEAHD